MATPVKIKAVVTEVIHHTATVASYHFKPQGRVPKFRPGQFLHIALDEYQPDVQWPTSRVFSIASSPSDRASDLAITISVKGSYTERIVKTLDKGTECWLKLPYGDFLFPPDKDLALIAGGVGITPFISLFRQMLEEKSTQSVSLFYGIRSAPYYLFGDLLDCCESELPNFKKNIWCEDGSLPGRTGMLDVDFIRESVPSGSLFYLSGPPVMILSFKNCLALSGVASECIRVDDWE